VRDSCYKSVIVHTLQDAHKLEGLWEQDDTNGGGPANEFLRVGHPASAWRLLIVRSLHSDLTLSLIISNKYFLQCMLEPLLPLNNTELASLRGAIEPRRRLFASRPKTRWIGILYQLCNRPTPGETKRRMLAALLRCLKRARVDGTWTERHSEMWSDLLTRREVNYALSCMTQAEPPTSGLPLPCSSFVPRLA
jgi:hypothetical protein